MPSLRTITGEALILIKATPHVALRKPRFNAVRDLPIRRPLPQPRVAIVEKLAFDGLMLAEIFLAG